MKLRIFSQNVASDDVSMAYKDFDCTSWEITGAVLVLFGPEIRYIPLCNIGSFKVLA